MNSFITHTGLTSPGVHAEIVSALPDDISSLVDVVRGLFVHGSFVRLYGVDEAQLSSMSRETLPLEKRLDQVLLKASEPLDQNRPIESRELVTCRDYAVMICGFLREKHIPARVRCGFASYFHSGRYEDHWICEYFSSIERRWIRVDGQLDDRLCEHLGVTFDTLDLPSSVFLTAREAWVSVCSKQTEPSLFGHGDTVGEWFLWVNLARDCLALGGKETSRWDTWRPAEKRAVYLDEPKRLLCNAIAERIEKLEGEQPSKPGEIDLNPFWPNHR